MNKLGFVVMAVMIAGGSASAQQAQPGTGTPAVRVNPPAPPAARPPTPPPTPVAPPELAELAKTLGGSWKCTGSGMSMDGSDVKMTATVKNRLDFDKYWLVTETTVKQGKSTIKMVAYTTYGGGKWRRLQVMNDGTQLVGTSDGPKDGKTTFNLDAMGAMGSSQFRDDMDLANVKTGAVLTGTMSMDKGKTWLPVYTMTCKR